MTADQLSILSLMDADPCHDRDKAAVIAAVRDAARRCNGTISRNDISPLIPTWVQPNVIGATISGLVNRKVLVWTGRYTGSQDHKGHNDGKPCKVYRADLTALAACGEGE